VSTSAHRSGIDALLAVAPVWAGLVPAAAVVALTGGLTLGTMVSMAFDLAVVAPPLAVGAFIAYGLWHRRRWAQAGWLLAGLALPSAILWSYSAALLLGGRPFIFPPG